MYLYDVIKEEALTKLPEKELPLDLFPAHLDYCKTICEIQGQLEIYHVAKEVNSKDFMLHSKLLCAVSELYTKARNLADGPPTKKATKDDLLNFLSNRAIYYKALMCKELRENKHFHEFLAGILSLGNIMNGGTVKGQADGFSLDLLPKLTGIKDSLGHSILTFVCSITHKSDPTFEGFKNKFPHLEKAAGFSMSETKKKLDELNNMVDTVDKLLNKLNTQDEFIKRANNSLEGAKQKVNGFKKQEEKNKDFYHETIKFFGYKEKDKYYDENGLFFKMLLNFFNEVDKQLPKFDVKRVLDYQNRMVGKKVDQSAIMRGLMTQLKQKIQG
jgi:hypothetical protein